MKQIIFIPGWGGTSDILRGMESGLGPCMTTEIEWEGVTEPHHHIEKVKKTFSQVNLEKTIVVAWSMGAHAALEVSVESPPAGLILFGVNPRFTIERESAYRCGWPPKVLKGMIRDLEGESPKAIEAFCMNLFSDLEKANGNYQTFRSQILNGFQSQKKQCLIAGLRYLEKVDLRQKLCKIKCPSLIIHGTDDRICPVEGGRYLSELLGEFGVFKVLNGAGHSAFLTQPSACLSLINEFSEERGLYDL